MKTPAKIQFARKIQTWRKRMGLSQSAAALALEMPKKTLQGWEIARTMPRGFALTEILKKVEKPSKAKNPPPGQDS